MKKEWPDPGPRPDNATPKELEAWRRANENFLTEGRRHLPTERPKIDATDARLKELRKDHVKFLEKMNPATDALWLALLARPQDNALDVELYDRYQAAILRGGGKEQVEMPEIPSIVLLAKRQVVNAMRGDNAAAAAIFDRIEGKPGLRAGDANPDDPEQVKKRREVVEDVVRTLTDERLRRKIETAVDARVTVIEPVKELDGNAKEQPSVVRP